MQNSDKFFGKELKISHVNKDGFVYVVFKDKNGITTGTWLERRNKEIDYMVEGRDHFGNKL